MVRCWALAAGGLTGLWLVGCTATNPAYDIAGDRSEGSTTAAEGDSTSGGQMETTMPPPESDGVDPTDPPALCSEPEYGSEVVVRPTAGVDPQLCGAAMAGTGLLSNDGAFRLHRDPSCLPVAEPTALTFAPKAPPVTNGESTCVQYELHFRPDCTLHYAVFADDAGLLFLAATFPDSPRPDAGTLIASPIEVCDCDLAPDGTCCPGAEPLGTYGLQLVVGRGVESFVEQGLTDKVLIAGLEYELGNMQSVVSSDCTDPERFDWYLRRIAL